MLYPPSYRKSRSRIVRYCAYSCLQGFFDDFCISTLRMNDISVCDIPCNLAPPCRDQNHFYLSERVYRVISSCISNDSVFFTCRMRPQCWNFSLWHD